MSSTMKRKTFQMEPSPPSGQKIKHQVPLCLQEVGHVTKRPSRANKRSDLLARSILPATVYPSVVPGPYIPPEYSHIIKGAAVGSSTLPSSNPSSSASTSAPKTPTTPAESQSTEETPTPSTRTNSEFDDDLELPEMERDQPSPREENRKTMLSEKEILDKYFHPDLREAAKKGHPWSDIGWCTVSETRLLKRLALHKPAGVFRGLEMIALVDDMRRITENDSLTDYRNELTPEDYELYMKRVESGEAQKNPRSYSPAYKVRPNDQAIYNKLNEFFNMKKVHEMELRANPVSTYFPQKDFELPPDLLKMKNATPH